MKRIYKLIPETKNNLWGGEKLRGYGKTSSDDIIAESWELSFVPGSEAHLEDGRTTAEAFPKELWGTSCEKFEHFPTLTKFIDAREKLSVQVHPSDAYALENEGQYGKTEMWYVVEAEDGAGLYMGLRHSCGKENFAAAVADGSVEDLLSFVKVKAGDIFFIPSGTIHAIGAGTLIFEIQQSSTLTYRLYDYMRRDKDGNLRELHIDKAMRVSLLEPYKPFDFSEHGENVIGYSDYFITELYKLNFTNISLNVDERSFLSITCTRGEGVIDGEIIKKGDTFLAPAGAGELVVSGDLDIVTVRV